MSNFQCNECWVPGVPLPWREGREGSQRLGRGNSGIRNAKDSPLCNTWPERSTCPRPRLLSCCPGTPPTMHAPWPNAPVPASQHVWKQTQQLSHRPPAPSGFPFSESGITISTVPWARNLQVLADTSCSPICCSQPVSKFRSSLEMLLTALPF